jgi:Fe-S-cluster containining protein
MRENILKLPPLYFNGCGDCSECCEGKFFLAPLILEDFEKVKKYFEIRAIILDEIIPVMLLTDGENSCKYLKNGKCEIYNDRPPACKIYPFSPYYDDIFIDLSCKAIGTIGNKLPTNKDEYINSPFFEERFIDFSKKRYKTIEYMKRKKLTFDKEVKGIKLYFFEI